MCQRCIGEREREEERERDIGELETEKEEESGRELSSQFHALSEPKLVGRCT